MGVIAQEVTMGWSQRRPKRRKIKLVGGGTRYSVSKSKKDSGVGGSMKAARRVARKLEKASLKRRQGRPRGAA